MMPEEKANTLYNEFFEIVGDKEKTKKCVITCIENIEKMEGYSSEFLYNISYWKRVKKYINKK